MLSRMGSSSRRISTDRWRPNISFIRGLRAGKNWSYLANCHTTVNGRAHSGFALIQFQGCNIMHFPANDRHCLTMPCAGGRCTPICLIALGFQTCLLLLHSYKLMLSTVLLSQIPIANPYEVWCCYSASDCCSRIGKWWEFVTTHILKSWSGSTS